MNKKVIHSVQGRLPMKEGIGSKQDASDEPTNLDESISTDKYKTLQELSVDYQLFTHGLWFSYGQIKADPLNEFIYEEDIKADLLLLNFDQVLFSGMGSIYWNLLFGCPREIWDKKLKAFLTETAGLNKPAGYFWRTLIQKIDFPDVLALRNISIHQEAKLPTIPIYVFGVDSNHGMAAIDCCDKSRLEYRVKIYPPEKLTVSLARSLLDPDPRTTNIH